MRVPLFDDVPNPADEALTPAAARRMTKIELLCAAHEAAKLLRRAVNYKDIDASRVAAAKAVLDRAGFGPTSTIMVDDAKAVDYSQYTHDQLMARAARLYTEIQTRKIGLDARKKLKDETHGDERMNEPVRNDSSVH
jgi:hypothetical protein